MYIECSPISPLGPIGTISCIDLSTTLVQLDCDIWQIIVDLATQYSLVSVYRNKWWYPETVSLQNLYFEIIQLPTYLAWH